MGDFTSWQTDMLRQSASINIALDLKFEASHLSQAVRDIQDYMIRDIKKKIDGFQTTCRLHPYCPKATFITTSAPSPEGRHKTNFTERQVIN